MSAETAVHGEDSLQAVHTGHSPFTASVHGEPQAVIANITEQAYMAQRMYGTFQIGGRGESQAYAVTRVTPRTAPIDYGDKRVLPQTISAREIAEDLCREINSDAGEQSFLGVFVCAGDTPTAQELSQAQSKLDEFYRALVAAADREWARSHSHLFIHDLQRRAAKSLGVEKEWHYDVKQTQECPGCGDRLKPGVAVCRSCGAILNRDKAVSLGILVKDATDAQRRKEETQSRVKS